MIRHAAPTVGMTLIWLLGSVAQAADEPLLAGVATVDITPEPGKMMWGYSNRTHGATGTLDPLMAKAVVLKSGSNSVAIVSLDLGRTPEESVLARIRAQTTAQCGVSNLFVTGASAFPQNPGYNPTGTVAALAYWSAAAIREQYLKNPGPLVHA